MDWMVMAIGAIFLIGFAVGIYKGAVKIAVSLAATVFTLIVVVIATPFVADRTDTGRRDDQEPGSKSNGRSGNFSCNR